MDLQPSGQIVRVDRNNTVLVEIASEVFARTGVDPQRFQSFLKPGRTLGAHQIKLGAAGVRYLGEIGGLGRDPRRWPSTLQEPLPEIIVEALPHAQERVETLRRGGKRVPWVVYSNDLARVRSDDPVAISARHSASAESSHEYESLVRAIKSETTSEPEKAEKLASVVLVLGVSQPESRKHDEELPIDLGPLARQFIKSSEVLAETLAGQAGLDWSGVVIGICKAFEYESVARLIDPLRDSLAEAELESDLSDKEFRMIARYCARQSATPPELGTIGRFLQTAAHSSRRAKTSALLRAFASNLQTWPWSEWLLSDDGGIAAFAGLTNRFRNRAAHIAHLSQADYRECRQYVLGHDGILRALVRATTPPGIAAARRPRAR